MNRLARTTKAASPPDIQAMAPSAARANLGGVVSMVSVATRAHSVVVVVVEFGSGNGAEVVGAFVVVVVAFGSGDGAEVVGAGNGGGGEGAVVYCRLQPSSRNLERIRGQEALALPT
mmetsp:Transcript_63773/g.197448  ORF Transcript_63773/g.197448 Transcript_63773/m.197448 type:complete len:117 (+) Transcript_63773:103-453(+)